MAFDPALLEPVAAKTGGFDPSLLEPVKSGFDPSLLVPVSMDAPLRPPPQFVATDSAQPSVDVAMPNRNPQPFSSKVAELASNVIGDPSGYGIAGWTDAASKLNPVTLPSRIGDLASKVAGTTPADQPFFADSEKPMISGDTAKQVTEQLVPFDNNSGITQGAGDFVKGLVEGLSSHKVVSQLAQSGLGANVGKVVTADFISRMAAEAPQQAADVGTKLGEGDTKGATTSFLNYVMSAGAPFGVAKGTGDFSDRPNQQTIQINPEVEQRSAFGGDPIVRPAAPATAEPVMELTPEMLADLQSKVRGNQLRPQPVTAAQPETVRMYHGGADPTGDLNGPRDLTPNLEYAKGYAAKSGEKVWYVDVPKDAPFMKKAFEEFEGGPKSPYINTVAPADVMRGAKPVESPNMIPKPISGTEPAPAIDPLHAKLDAVNEKLDALLGKKSAPAESSNVVPELPKSNEVKPDTSENPLFDGAETAKAEQGKTESPDIKFATRPDGSLKTKSEYTSDEWKAYTDSVIASKEASAENSIPTGLDSKGRTPERQALLDAMAKKVRGNNEPMLPKPLTDTPATAVEKVKGVRQSAKEFDKLVLEHAMPAEWTANPDALYSDPIARKGGGGLGTMGIKAKILQNAEMAKARRRAAKDLGIDPDTINQPSVRAANLEKLKQHIEQRFPDTSVKDAAFEKARTSPAKLNINASQLKVGDVLNIKGESVKVTHVDPDTMDVTLQDGSKFGTQTLSDGSTVFADEWHSEHQSDEFGHTEPVVPKLRSGEKQGDVFANQQEPFALAGEKGADVDRLDKEKADASKRAAEAKAIADRQQTGFTSMGGLAPSDPLEPVGKSPKSEGGHGADIYGVAERVRDKRFDAGQVDEVKPGVGISTPDSIARGRDIIASGVKPEEVLQQFEKTKRLSSDDMAVVRAHGEQLFKAARNIEGKFGTESPEYNLAKDAANKWDARTKPMQTEWNKTGMAQQGETDLDTGSYTGLQREYFRQSGKDFTERQAESATRIAADNAKAEADLSAAKEKLYNEPDITGAPEPIHPKILELARKWVEKWDKDAKESMKSLLGATWSPSPETLLHLAKVARGTIAHGTLSFAEWSADMVSQIGEKVRPYLKDAWDKGQELIDKETAIPDAAKRAIKSRKKAATIETIEDAKKALSGYTGGKFTPDQVKTLWQSAKKFYLEKGEDDFDNIRNKLATDLGMKVDDVTRGLSQNQSTRRLANDVWQKQQEVRRLKGQAVRWLAGTQLPLYKSLIQSVPRTLFSLKVGFHGTVALGTHAPMLAFQPTYWATYFDNFKKMYRMSIGNPLTAEGRAGAKIFYEIQMADLLRRPNYTEARRAGLVNDPHTFEDFNNPAISEFLGKMSAMGNRGYSVLKLLRQDMFDQQWDKLPKSLQTPEMAKAIADGANHVTGVVKSKAPTGASVALFAPRLGMSRVAWLYGDPIRAVDTFARWPKATPAEKMFAINQAKEKAWVVGTMMGMLAANQGLLTASGSKQKVNMSDPMKGDFIKFKMAGMTASYGNAMTTMARLPIRLWAIRQSEGGKLKNVVYPDESTYASMGEFLRSQESPFAGLATDLWFRSDWMRRPLPNSNRPMPKRLAMQGVKPYTWTEFWMDKALPIPFAEANKEVWKTGLGMSDEQVKQAFKAMSTIAIMSATGGRLSDDYELDEKHATATNTMARRK